MQKQTATTKQEIQFSNYRQYAEAAERTLSEVITQYENIPQELNERFNINHMGLGVATEYFELVKAIRNNDNFNTSEELGDTQWYIGNHLLKIFKPTDKIWNALTEIWFKPQYSILSVEEEMNSIFDLFELYTDLCKKHGAYGKKVEHYEENLRYIAINIAKSEVGILMNQAEVKPKECLERNIQKLLERYPANFDSFLAMNRDLVKERQILEGK